MLKTISQLILPTIDSGYSQLLISYKMKTSFNRILLYMTSIIESITISINVVRKYLPMHINLKYFTCMQHIYALNAVVPAVFSGPSLCIYEASKYHTSIFITLILMDYDKKLHHLTIMS